LINLKYIKKKLKNHKFSMHYLRKTLIILTALISFFCGFLFSRSLLPNSEEREDKRNVNNEKPIVNVETEDGEYQIFVSSSGNGNFSKEMRLITISEDKKIVRLIKSEFVGEIYSFQISHDGKKVLVDFAPATSRHQRSFYIMNIDGTERINLTEGMWLSYGASISPDGKKVAFIGYMSGYSSDFVDSPDPSLWLVNTDGTERTNLLKGMRIKGEITGSPLFSPDSNKILFKLHQSGSESLCIFDLNEEKITTLVEAESVNEHYYQFSPDGKKILFVAGFKKNKVVYFVGTDNLTGEPRYTGPAAGRFYIINNDGTSMISLEEMITSNIQDAKWVPYEKNDS